MNNQILVEDGSKQIYCLFKVAQQKKQTTFPR